MGVVLGTLGVVLGGVDNPFPVAGGVVLIVGGIAGGRVIGEALWVVLGVLGPFGGVPLGAPMMVGLPTVGGVAGEPSSGEVGTIRGDGLGSVGIGGTVFPSGRVVDPVFGSSGRLNFAEVKFPKPLELTG